MLYKGRKCRVGGCGSLVVVQELCGKHYKRLQRYGDTGAVMRPPGWGSMKNHPLYGRWMGMLRAYRDDVCDEWKDFWAFVRDVGEVPEGCRYLRRRDRSKPFSKSNCFWETQESTKESRAEIAKFMAEYYKRNPDVFRNLWYKKRYGITLDEYETLLKEQKGRCKLCNKKETVLSHKTGKPFRLSVDHCHKSKKVRGLLCQACNRGLGFFRHDQKLLENAIRYVEHFS